MTEQTYLVYKLTVVLFSTTNNLPDSVASTVLKQRKHNWEIKKRGRKKEKEMDEQEEEERKVDRQKKEEEGQIGLVKLSWDLALSYQTRNEGLKAALITGGGSKCYLSAWCLLRKERAEA